MNIDFIKKCVEKAEGWKIKDDGAIVSLAGLHFYPDSPIVNPPGGFNGTLSVQEMWMLDYYPIIIQKAIEGVNRKAVKDPDNITIKQFSHDIVVHLNARNGFRKCFSFSDYDSEDEAKTAALKYVFEMDR